MCKPWFAYATLVALQLKVAWGAWRFRDLTIGDTSSYFVYATLWTDLKRVNIVWSPLYTVFYGMMLETVGDLYAATILHRLLIALAADLLVLALMRRLLPGPIAWLVAAWWTLLPINFDTVSEVHLFALLPILLAWLVVATWRGPWGRGTGLGIIAAAMVLSRNELLVPWALLGAACLTWDLRQVRAGATRLRDVVLAYSMPFALAAVLCAGFYARSIIQFPALWEGYGPKHTVNMCQVFAVGYAQRHPEWTKNPMMECEGVMARHFGEGHPTLGRMLRSNPRATLEHFWWNLSLTPSGIQLLLFNATSGRVNPDYFPVRTGSRLALVASLLVMIVLLAGGAALYRDRQRWWREWFRSRMGAWLFIVGTVVPHSLVVTLTQRPRPSYLFDLGVCLMGIVATCCWALWRRWAGAPSAIATDSVRRKSAVALLWLMILLALVVPSYYEGASGTPRPLLESYRRLAPFAELIGRDDAVLLVNGHSFELAHYIGRSRPRALDYSQIVLDPAGKIDAFLDERGVNLFYVDETLASRLPRSSLFVDPLQPGRGAVWDLLAFEDGPHARWRLWGRRTFLNLTGGGAPARTGVEQSFQAGSRLDSAALHFGWAMPEKWGVWSDGPEARLVVDPKPGSLGGGDLGLIVRAMGFVTPKHPRQTVDVLVNGTSVALWTFELGDGFVERRARVPAAVVKFPLEITFRIRNAMTPAQLGISGDARRLGIGLASLRLAPAADGR